MESLLTEFPSARHLINLGLSFPFAAYMDAMRRHSGDVVAAADWLMNVAANGNEYQPPSPSDRHAPPSLFTSDDGAATDGTSPDEVGSTHSCAVAVVS